MQALFESTRECLFVSVIDLLVTQDLSLPEHVELDKHAGVWPVPDACACWTWLEEEGEEEAGAAFLVYGPSSLRRFFS